MPQVDDVDSPDATNRQKSAIADILRGFAAGAVASGAMSLAQRAEMAVTGRGPSATPAEAGCLLLGIETRTEAQEQRLAREAHWAYGTSWGIGQALLSRVPEPERTLLFFMAVWSAGAGLLTAAELAPPPTQWNAKSLLADLGHHAVYAVAASLTFHAFGRLLPGRRTEERR